MKKDKPQFTIGIDPGVNTGIAIWDNRKDKLVYSGTLSILEAIEEVEEYHTTGYRIRLNVEDPNLREWFGSKKNPTVDVQAKAQGAGSVKRDFKIWKEFAEMYDIELHGYHPKDVGSKTHKEISMIIGWGVKGRTSQHERDAIVLSMKRY
jgi:hypothetical protein